MFISAVSPASLGAQGAVIAVVQGQQKESHYSFVSCQAPWPTLKQATSSPFPPWRELKTTRGMDRLAKYLEQPFHSVWMLHFQPFSLSTGLALLKVKNLSSQAPWLSLAFLILLYMEGATWVG